MFVLHVINEESLSRYALWSWCAFFFGVPALAAKALVFGIFAVFVGLLASCAESVESRVLSLTTVVTDQADEEVRQKIAQYQERVAADSTNANAVGELGVRYELHGFPSAALIAYDLASEMDPAEFKWPYYHGILLAARFDLELAIQKVDQAIELLPDYAPARLQKGKLLLDNSQYEKALELFQYTEQLTEDPYVFVGQALAYLELNDANGVLAALDQTGRMAGHPNVQRLRATALIRSGRTEEGSKLLAGLRGAPTIRWDDPIAQAKESHSIQHFITKLSKAVRLIRARSFDSALFLLSELRLSHPTNKHVLHLLSSVYESLGNGQKALEILEEGMQFHPDFYVLYTAAASLLKANGDIERATQHLDRAIEIDPKLHWAYSQKAQLLMEQRKWLNASHLLDQAIGLKDDDADLYTYLGICLGFLNRWPEASNLYRVAISINPKHVPSYINLARAETILNNEEKALEALDGARSNGATPAMIASLEQQRVQIKRMRIDTVKR